MGPVICAEQPSAKNQVSSTQQSEQRLTDPPRPAASAQASALAANSSAAEANLVFYGDNLRRSDIFPRFSSLGGEVEAEPGWIPGERRLA